MPPVIPWRGRLGGIVLTLVLVAVAGVVSSTSSATRREITRSTVDETLVCSTSLLGGLQNVTVQAHVGTGRRGSRWYRPALASVTTGTGGDVNAALDYWLAWVTAGNPTRDSTVVPDPYRGYTYPLRIWGTLAVNVERCREVAERVPLSGAGLRRRQVGGLGVRFKCNGVPKDVLVRVHGTLAGRPNPHPYAQFNRVTAPLLRAQIAVRTFAGRQLAYAELLASGEARLLTARSCTSG